MAGGAVIEDLDVIEDGGFQPVPTRPADGVKQHAKCGGAPEAREVQADIKLAAALDVPWFIRSDFD